MTRQVAVYRTVLVIAVLGTAAFALSQTLTGTEIDLAVYRMGGHAVATGHDVYSARSPGLDLPFTYPPSAAVTFVPLALLPLVAAQILWAVVAAACLVLVIRLAARELGQAWSAGQTALVFAAMFWLEPVRHTFIVGQINLVIMALCMTDLLWLRGSRHQGYLIGIAAGLKLTPLIFIPYLLITSRRRPAIRAAAGFAGLLLLGLPAGTRVSWGFWRHDALSSAHIGGVPYVGNQSLTGVVTRWLHHQPSGLAWDALLAVVLCAGLAVAVQLHRAGAELAAVSFVAGVGLLVSPISWSHHFVWIVPMLMVVFSRGGRNARRTAAVVSAVFYLAPIWWPPNTHDREFHHHGWQLIAACSFFLGLLALLACLRASTGGVAIPTRIDLAAAASREESEPDRIGACPLAVESPPPPSRASR